LRPRRREDKHLSSRGREEASYSREKIAMSTTAEFTKRRIAPQVLRSKKERGERISIITAYDYPMALAVERAGIDAILVGDSLGMVVLGYETTLPVTMEEMLHHCRAVARGAKVAHLIGDMPFMSYQASPSDAVRNAGRFLQEGGMDAVKLEGGREVISKIKAIEAAGIPVMGHLGLTPQSIRKFGGYKTQGKSAAAASRLVEDAHRLEDAGCYALVLEAVPDRVAGLVARRLQIPVIGIGAGTECDGQVLVVHDMLGMFDRFAPKFVKKYAELQAVITQAVRDYIQDVSLGRFPDKEHSYAIADDEYNALLEQLRPALQGIALKPVRSMQARIPRGAKTHDL
jgi:3-methyl-2-oxobutanoate hydroxymethyltransferase